jgi:hypothetical protein
MELALLDSNYLILGLVFVYVGKLIWLMGPVQ